MRDLLYADNRAIVAHSEDDRQRLVGSLFAATKRFGLTISIKNTEVMFQPVKGSRPNMIEIEVDGKALTMLISSPILEAGVQDSGSHC